MTVPKIVIGDTVITSYEELNDLWVRSALSYIARGNLTERPKRCSLQNNTSPRTIGVLHSGPTTAKWLKELSERLHHRGAKVEFIDVENLGPFDIAMKLNYCAVVNRVSDAVPPPLARFVVSFLSLCDSQNIPVINGAAAYGTATSKIAQHGIFHGQGLQTPRSYCVRCAADVEIALKSLSGCSILFKPNAGSFGKGIVNFDDMEALRVHSARPAVYGNDGMAILQEFHEVQQVYRVFVLDGAVQCSVVVDTTHSQFTGQCMASAQSRLAVDGTPAVKSVTIPAKTKNACESAMRASRANVGSIEYLIDARNEPLFYDLNLLSTYPDTAVVGRDCWQELADFIMSIAVDRQDM